MLRLPIPKTRLHSVRLVPSSRQTGVLNLDPSFPTTDYSAPATSHTTPSSLLTVTFYNTSARTTQKTAFIFEEACLLVHYLAMNVLLHAYTSRGCLPSRCLAMNIHVTIFQYPIWYYFCLHSVYVIVKVKNPVLFQETVHSP
jgi:hypothetical protein